MVIGRRQFLGYAATALTVALRTDGSGSEPSVVSVLDLKEHCSLRESLAGYERASAGCVTRRPLLIVPAALALPAAATGAMANCLRRGGTVLLESGAGYAAESDCRVHREALRNRLQVRVAAARFKSRRVPYVDYAWPSPTKIRDFSRVVPLAEHQSGEIIAWADGFPVALKRRIGSGTLIYVGSPLGPALWAGDTEARQWLSRLFSL
ncbi:MAG TPA: hypothetical protein VGJ80_04135 [Gemmatimonadales bacterium]|jgi:hypothetical protein